MITTPGEDNSSLSPEGFEQQLASLMAQLAEADSFGYLAVGVAMSLFSLLFLAINLAVLLIILGDRDLRRLNSYKFMLALGIADCTQLAVHFITGFFTIWQITVNPWLNKFLGVIITPSYIFYAILTTVLAINRLISISSIKMDNVLFSSQGMKFWLSGSGLIAFGFCLALSSPWASIIYFPDQLSWSYDYSLEFSSSVQFFEMIIEIGGIFLSGIIYAAIFCLLLSKKKYFSNNCQQHCPTSQQHSSSTQSTLFIVELKVLVQAFVITAYCTVLNFLWHNSERLLPHTKAVYCALNLMWIGNGAVNPLIYFAVNITIRDRIFTTIGAPKSRFPHQNRLEHVPKPMHNNFINANAQIAVNWTPKSA